MIGEPRRTTNQYANSASLRKNISTLSRGPAWCEGMDAHTAQHAPGCGSGGFACEGESRMENRSPATTTTLARRWKYSTTTARRILNYIPQAKQNKEHCEL